MHYRETFKIDKKLRSLINNVDRDESTYEIDEKFESILSNVASGEEMYIFAIEFYFEYKYHVEVDFSEHDYIDKDGVVVDSIDDAKYIIIRVY